MKRKLVILIVSLVLAYGGFYIYQEYKIPDGIVVQGDNDEVLSIIGLLTAIISLISAVIQFFLIIKMRK